MKRITALLPLFAFSVLLMACSDHTAQAETAADNSNQTAQSESSKDQTVVAKVNGEAITKNQLDQAVIQKKATKPKAKIDRSAVLDQLITLQLVKQKAQAAGIDQSPAFKAKLEQQRSTLLVNTFMRKKFGDVDFSEQELKKAYNKQVKGMGGTEYKARHILSDSKEKAQAIIKKLNNGADFVKLAKAQSNGPSASSGGDLGWFDADTMVPKFAEAIQDMNKGSYSKEPIKTQFGWHVIKLEDRRKSSAPEYEDIKPRLKATLTQQKLKTYLQGLRSDADIKQFPEKAQ